MEELPESINIPAIEEFPDQIKPWVIFAKQFFPLLSITLRKTWIFLLVSFLISFVILYFFLNPFKYANQYALFMVPGNNAQIGLEELNRWNDLLEEHFSSAGTFQTSWMDEINYQFEKKKYSVLINVTMRNSNKKRMALDSIRFYVNSFNKISPEKASVRLVNNQETSSESNLIYSSIISSAFVLLELFAAILAFSFDNRIYQIKSLKVFGKSLLGAISRNDDNTYIVSSAYSRSNQIIEDLQQIHTRLSFLETSVPKKVILFASSIYGEGKSFILLNYGVLEALKGKRVVIVDSNLRKPKLATMLGQENNSGITNYLINNTPITDIVKMSYMTENLFIVCSGLLPHNPLDLIQTDKFKVLIDCLREEFDLVLLDSPPLLPSADGYHLSRLADQNIVITRFNYSNIHYTANVFNMLKNLNENTFLIVNDVEKTWRYWNEFR